MKSKKHQPLVSFIMPVYNAEQYLQETIHSILEQTYSNFEVVAIDDGSTDQSLAILKKYEKIDPRIRVISRANKGLVYTLNEGIRAANGVYLARIDADDLCTPRRLEWQVNAMEKNTAAVLCTGAFEMIDEDGTCVGMQVVPANSGDIKLLAYTRNPIAHASVMLRKDLLPIDPYSANVGPTEDYELWSRLIVNHDAISVPHVLMRYRINTSGIMHTIGHKQWKYMKINLDNYWQTAGLPPVLGPRTIRKIMRTYMDTFPKYGYGIAMFTMVIDGQTHAAVKALKRGYLLHGIKMMLGVAFSSRTGLRMCMRRIGLIVKGKADALVSSLRSQSSPDAEEASVQL